MNKKLFPFAIWPSGLKKASDSVYDDQPLWSIPNPYDMTSSMNQSPSLGETMSGMLLGHLDPNMDDVIEGSSPRREGLTEKEKESLERLKPRTADRIGTGDYSIGALKQDMDDADTTQDIRTIARGLHSDLKPGVLRSLGIPMDTKILGISPAPDGIFDLWHTDKIFQEAFPERYAELKRSPDFARRLDRWYQSVVVPGREEKQEGVNHDASFAASLMSSGQIPLETPPERRLLEMYRHVQDPQNARKYFDSLHQHLVRTIGYNPITEELAKEALRFNGVPITKDALRDGIMGLHNYLRKTVNYKSSPDSSMPNPPSSPLPKNEVQNNPQISRTSYKGSVSTPAAISSIISPEVSFKMGNRGFSAGREN